MASKEPPLIRSSKAFSVEIPEGSNSAKARRSDVSAGLVEGEAAQDPHFETPSQVSPASGHAQEVQSHSTGSSLSHDEAHEDRFAGGQTDADPEASVGVPADHFEHTSTGSMEEKDDLHDHLIGVSDTALEDHIAAIPNAGLEDHLAAIPNEGIKDHLAAIPNEGVKDHPIAVSAEGSQDHFAALPQDNVKDSHAALPDEAIEDHHVSVEEPEPQAPIPLFVSADDDFPDDHMEIDYPAQVDPNAQPLEDEAVVDHVAHLPDGGHVLADAQLVHSQAPTAETVLSKPAAHQPIPVLAKATTLLTPEMVIKKHEEEMAARKLRMEEFHGRVDAIRQTVSSINAKLDQIAPHEGKPPGH